MRPADLTPLARDVMRSPARMGLVFFSLLAAYVLSVLPWSGWLLLVRPDFVLVVVLFWAVNEPRAMGQGLAFALGLLMDVSDSMLLGQHALAYVVAVYGAQIFRVRILSFQLPEQMLHVLGLLTAATVVMLLLNLLLGADFPGAAMFISPLLSCFVWPFTSWFLYLPRMRRSRNEAAS
jgi:rod shape-determining protein MreD